MVWIKSGYKNLFLRFYVQSTNMSILLTGSGADVLTWGRNVRGLSEADCRAGTEVFSHGYTMHDI